VVRAQAIEHRIEVVELREVAQADRPAPDGPMPLPDPVVPATVLDEVTKG
jgi:hypothetical protein